MPREDDKEDRKANVPVLLPRLRQLRYRNRPSAEGRSKWLTLLRKILSFSIPNRFIPVHPDTFLFDTFLFRLLELCAPVCGSIATQTYPPLTWPTKKNELRHLSSTKRKYHSLFSTSISSCLRWLTVSGAV